MTNDLYIGLSNIQPDGQNNGYGTKDLTFDGQNHIADLHAMHITPGNNANNHVTIQNFRKLYGSDIYGPLNEWNNSNKSALLTYRNVNYEGSQLSHSTGVKLEIDGVVNDINDSNSEGDTYNSPYESNVSETDGGGQQQNLEINSMTVDPNATFNGLNYGGDSVDVLGGNVNMEQGSTMNLTSTVGQDGPADQSANGAATALYVENGTLNIANGATLTANGTNYNNLKGTTDNNYRSQTANALDVNGAVNINGGTLDTTVTGTPKSAKPIDINGTVNVTDNGKFKAQGSKIGQNWSNALVTVELGHELNVSRQGNLDLSDDRPSSNFTLLGNSGAVNIINPGKQALLSFTNDSNGQGHLFQNSINAYSTLVGEASHQGFGSDNNILPTPIDDAQPFYSVTIPTNSNITANTPTGNNQTIPNSSPTGLTALAFYSAPTISFNDSYKGYDGNKTGIRVGDLNNGSLSGEVYGDIRFSLPNFITRINPNYSAPIYLRITDNSGDNSLQERSGNPVLASNNNINGNENSKQTKGDTKYTLEFIPTGNNKYEEYDGSGYEGTFTASPVSTDNDANGANVLDLPFSYAGLSNLGNRNSITVEAHYSVNNVQETLFDDNNTPNNIRLHKADVNPELDSAQNEKNSATDPNNDPIIYDNTTIHDEMNGNRIAPNYQNNINNDSSATSSDNNHIASLASDSRIKGNTSASGKITSDSNVANSDSNSISNSDNNSSAFSNTNSNAQASSASSQANSADKNADSNFANVVSSSASSNSNKANINYQSASDSANNYSGSDSDSVKADIASASNDNGIINSANNQIKADSNTIKSLSSNGNTSDASSADSLTSDMSKEASSADSASNDINSQSNNVSTIINNNNNGANNHAKSASNDANSASSDAGDNSKGASQASNSASSYASNASRANNQVHTDSSDALPDNNSSANNQLNSLSADASSANHRAQNDKNSASNDDTSANNDYKRASQDASNASSYASHHNSSSASSADADASQANSSASSASNSAKQAENDASNEAKQASNDASSADSIMNSLNGDKNHAKAQSANNDASSASNSASSANFDSANASSASANANSASSDTSKISSTDKEQSTIIVLLIHV